MSGPKQALRAKDIAIGVIFMVIFGGLYAAFGAQLREEYLDQWPAWVWEVATWTGVVVIFTAFFIAAKISRDRL